MIEYAGEPVQSVKKAIARLGRSIGVNGPVSPHIFRHSSAVHMAEAGVPMEEIARYLAHDDVKTTREIYARFSPDCPRGAASALEYDDLGSMNLPTPSQNTAEVPEYSATSLALSSISSNAVRISSVRCLIILP